MGQEVTDPFRQCCCASAYKIDNANTLHSGNNTYYNFEDQFYANIDWIIKIQAHWRGKIMRMKYQKRREEGRKKSAHFLIQDQMETISKRRVIELHLLFDANEAELA